MTVAQAGASDYDARIRRARDLAAAHSFAREVLTFYQQLALFQKRLCAQILQHSGGQAAAPPDGQLRGELDLAVLVPHLPDLLSLLESIAPAPTAQAARQLSLQGPAAWIAFLSDFWTVGGLPAYSRAASQEESTEMLTEFILRAFLQPYAEFLSARLTVPEPTVTQRVCPRCGSLPLLGVLRPEGDGGKRFLLCSFCLREWDFRRLLCPACGEEAESKLPVYVAEQFPHVRVEACDTCKFYLRTIDLTKDGHAVPLVDDLAAIPLTLWADEHGYTRLHANLLGT
jgi:formate dehydrogenase maturation protein FdhE